MSRLFSILALLPILALANPQNPAPLPASNVANSGASAAASANAGAVATASNTQGQIQGQTQGQQQVAQGGTAISQGGSVGDTTLQNTNTLSSQGGAGGDSASSASADNAGNSLSVNTAYPRQAPSTAQGSLMIGACGAGGNAGGSNSHGSAFLGFAFTPQDCKLLLAAAAYQALGMYDSACEMVNGIKAVKARWKALGVEAPSCEVKPSPVTPPAQPVSIVVQPPSGDYVTRAEFIESQKRQTERLTSK